MILLSIAVRQANTNNDHGRTVLSASLVSDIGRTSTLDSINHVYFDPSSTSLVSVSSKYLLLSPAKF